MSQAPKTTDLITEQDVWSISETPKFQLGAIAKTVDGRVYRYAKNGGTALAAGKLTVAGAGFLAQDNHADIAVNTAVKGDESVTVTLGATAATADEYAGGYLVVNDDTGEGISYKISGHAAADSAASLVVNLEDPIQVAFAANTTVTLTKNKYSEVVIATGGTQTDVPTGVPNVAVTASYYCWLQTGGVCAVLQSGTNTPTKGEPVTIGEATNGTVSGRDAIAEPLVGIGLDTATSGEYNPVYLKLD
jgi:hypothetical protein